MCGVCGVMGFNGALLPERKIVQSMAKELDHRGPDDHGIFMDDYCALGHKRLSIIDLTNGAQPMSTKDGRWWIQI